LGRYLPYHKNNKEKMSERKKDIIFLGIGIPLLLGLIVYDEVVGVMFAVGVCLGSLIEKFGWNDRNC